MRDLAVALDVGTRKICAIVAEVRPEDIFVVGVGIEPSAGMRHRTQRRDEKGCRQ